MRLSIKLTESDFSVARISAIFLHMLKPILVSMFTNL